MKRQPKPPTADQSTVFVRALSRFQDEVCAKVDAALLKAKARQRRLLKANRKPLHTKPVNFRKPVEMPEQTLTA